MIGPISRMMCSNNACVRAESRRDQQGCNQDSHVPEHNFRQQQASRRCVNGRACNRQHKDNQQEHNRCGFVQAATKVVQHFVLSKFERGTSVWGRRLGGQEDVQVSEKSVAAFGGWHVNSGTALDLVAETFKQGGFHFMQLLCTFVLFRASLLPEPEAHIQRKKR